MIYLLDVNALVALGLAHHEFHDRVAAWVSRQTALEMATCSITELGFLRVLSQAPAYGVTLQQARMFLTQFRKAQVFKHRFLADANDASRLPSWVKTPRQVTDGHLLALAHAHGSKLATLDERIPGAYLIPR